MAATEVVPLNVPPLGFVWIASVTVAVLLVRFPTASWICTVTAGVMAEAACVFVGCCPNTRTAGAPALTVIVFDVPVMLPVTVSVAVIVWLPAVFSVAESVPVPLVKVELEGKTAWPSVLVKCTDPLYAVAVLFRLSRAVTVKLKAVPAVAAPGADTAKCVAAAAPTTMLFDVPVMLLVTVSVAVMVWPPAVFSVAESDPVPFVKVEFDGRTAWPSLLVKCTVPA
jgi:hypothetical protein